MVQARVEGRADAQDLLMEYCKMKKAHSQGLLFYQATVNLLLFASNTPVTPDPMAT